MTVTSPPETTADRYRDERDRRPRGIAALEPNLKAFPLSPAELRLAPFLATSLSFAAIGQRLHVSRSTVKTQALSIYRKLGASSRTSAVEALIRLDLLPDVFAAAMSDLLDDNATTGCPVCGHPTPISPPLLPSSDN